MDAVVKAELKALLHLLVDHSEQSLIDDAKAKITNPSILGVVSILEASLLPQVIAAEDKAIDTKLA